MQYIARFGEVLIKLVAIYLFLTLSSANAMDLKSCMEILTQPFTPRKIRLIGNQNIVTVFSRRAQYDFKNPDFPGLADVDRYLMRIERPGNLEPWLIVAVIPPSADGSADIRRLHQVERALAKLSVHEIEAVDAIAVSPYPRKLSTDETKRCAGTAHDISARVSPNGLQTFILSLYPAEYENFLATMRHELGHLMVKRKFKSYDPPPDYVEATYRDGNQVSEYGSKRLSEDIAEAVELYFRVVDTIFENFYRSIYPNRFAFIETYLLSK